MSRARFKRKYKDISVGNSCRNFKMKQTYSELKEHVKSWSEATYKVIEVDRSGINGQLSYKLDGLTKPDLRNELLLVE